MKLFLTALGASLLSMSAHAAVVSYDFTATVEVMYELNGNTQVRTGVESSTFSGNLIANGHTVRGRLSYDTATPSTVPTSGSDRAYAGSSANLMILAFDQTGYRYQSNAPTSATLLVDNSAAGSGSDAFGMLTSAVGSPVYSETLGLYMTNANGAAFNTLTPPSALNLADFYFAAVTYTYTRLSDGSRVGAGIRLNSLDLVPAEVPEPASIALLMLGLAAIGGLNATKQKRR